MPYFNVTDRWLREKASELNRMARLYVTSAEYETYFTRIATLIGGAANSANDLRIEINKILAYLHDLEERQDNV